MNGFRVGHFPATSSLRETAAPVNLASFNNSWYSPGRSTVVRALWFFAGTPIVRTAVLPFSGLKRAVLRAFGARVGRGVVIKPGVKVKYPWLLEVGDHVWIGEDCWIDNLAMVSLGSNSCISQGVYLCTGNHDWSDPSFGLITKSIRIGTGSWLAARTVVGPGVTVGNCAVTAAGSVVTKDVPAHEIHGGNPAVFLKKRHIVPEVEVTNT
jgi:putative colanic acid biosynthesis acetyltransferase WcaF